MADDGFTEGGLLWVWGVRGFTPVNFDKIYFRKVGLKANTFLANDFQIIPVYCFILIQIIGNIEYYKYLINVQLQATTVESMLRLRFLTYKYHQES